MNRREQNFIQATKQLNWYFHDDDGIAAEKITKDAYEILKKIAFESLKELTPSVIDYNDLKDYEVVWLEDVDKEEIVPGVINEISDNEWDPYVCFDVGVNAVFGRKDEYNKRWRAWSNRPSDNVRYTEAWNG